MDSIVGSAAFLLSILLLSKLFLLAVSATRKNKKKLPPSPPSLPIIGHLHYLKKPQHRSLADLASLHGPVLSLRFGSRPVLLVSSASAVEECFTTNDVAFANRPALTIIKYVGANLVWASYDARWRNLRRITTMEILSSRRIESFSGIRMEEVKYLLSRLHQDCGQQDFKKVEMRTRFFGVSFNVMMRILTGKRYYGEDVQNTKEAKRFKKIMEDMMVLSGAVIPGDHLPWLRWMDINGMEKKLTEWKAKNDAFYAALISQRRATRASRRVEDEKGADDSGRTTVLDVLLSLQEQQPEYYTDDVIMGTILDLLSAGTDTTMVTMEWAMSLLLNHPEAMERARAEVDSCVRTSRMVEESDIPQLPYLQAIIRETLRLHPPGPLLPHESSKDITIGGYDIPRGTMLLVNVWAIQRDEKVWEDATKFKPERFLPAKGGGAAAVLAGCKSIPFGYGRRGCPGEAVAMKELGLVLGNLIQHFDWEKIGGVEVDITDGHGLTIAKATPLEVMCKTREGLRPFLS